MIKLYFLLSVILYSFPVCADDGYIAVNPGQIQTVDGTTLTVVSYVIVLGLLGLYGIHLFVQSRIVTARLAELKREKN